MVIKNCDGRLKNKDIDQELDLNLQKLGQLYVTFLECLEGSVVLQIS